MLSKKPCSICKTTSKNKEFNNYRLKFGIRGASLCTDCALEVVRETMLINATEEYFRYPARMPKNFLDKMQTFFMEKAKLKKMQKLNRARYENNIAPALMAAQNEAAKEENKDE